MRAKLAVVTMVYNERTLLPVWLRHYGRAAGTANCLVVDHGSDDGSTAPERLGGAGVLRLPRSPQDDTLRTAFVGELCAGLLRWYEAVIYTDVDELLVADPDTHGSLAAVAGWMGGGVAADVPALTAVGLDVVHDPDGEAALDWDRPVGEQRRWLRFSSAMCKPVLIRRTVDWAPGFHCTPEPPRFGPLFLLHLRYADLGEGLARLARTRAQPWSSPEAGSHQRMPDRDWEGMLRGMAGLPRRDDVTLRPGEEPLAGWLAAVAESAERLRGQRYAIDLQLSGDALWRVPDRLAPLF